MDARELCMSCMKVKGNFEVCMHCGYMEGTPPHEKYHLFPRTMLNERYLIGRVLGFGGFGVTYNAFDLKLNIRVAVKEYFPNGLVSRVPGEKDVVVFSGERKVQYDSGKQRFLEEARNMAKFKNNPYIVRVMDYFEANNAAYIVMEYLEGMSLREMLATEGGKIPFDATLNIIIPVIGGLKDMHKAGIIHRDVSPDNIFVTKDGNVKLIDFGAARFSSGEPGETHSVILKPGYTPPEQYRSKSRQGPWSDVYAVGATLYRIVTSITPEESIDRLLDDRMLRPSELGVELPDYAEKAIMKAIALKEPLRFQNMKAFEDALLNKKAVVFPEIEFKRRKRIRIIAAGIAIAAMLIACFAFLLLNRWMPGPDTITVFMPAESLTDMEAMSAAANAFEKAYEGYKINIVTKPEQLYAGILREYELESNMPDIFRGDLYEGDLKEDSLPLDNVLRDTNNGEYYFLGQYVALFPNKNMLPTGFETPVLFVNKKVFKDFNLNIPLDRWEKDTLSETVNFFSENDGGKSVYALGIAPEDIDCLLSAIGGTLSVSGESVSPDQAANDALLYIRNLSELPGGLKIGDGMEESMANGELAMYIGSSDDLQIIKQGLAGDYAVLPIPGSGALKGRFRGLWSVSSSSSQNRHDIALLFLRFLLDEETQNLLHVQNNAAMPLNRKAFTQYLIKTPDFAFLSRYLPEMRIDGEDVKVIADYVKSLYG